MSDVKYKDVKVLTLLSVWVIRARENPYCFTALISRRMNLILNYVPKVNIVSGNL